MTPRNALKAVLLLAVVAALMFPAAALAGEKADQHDPHDDSRTRAVSNPARS